MPEVKAGSRSFPFLAIILLALFSVITGAIAMHRTVKGSNDFDTFYEAGRCVIESRGIYYTGEYREDARGSAPFLYLPGAALFFAPFAILPLRFAAFIWNLFNIGCFAASLAMLGSLFDFSLKDPCWRKIPLPLKLVAALMALSILLDNLSMAQINIVVFGFTLLALLMEKRGQDWLSGLALSLAVVLKITPVLFFLYFLLNRKWKVLSAAMLGLILWTAVLPSFCFGIENNRIYHRQWAGRMIKPLLMEVVPAFKNQAAHPRKESPEAQRLKHLGDVLVDKNQSLEGTLTRFFLKDRNAYAYSGSYPLYPVRSYMKLPVIAGGLGPKRLAFAVLILRLLFLGALTGLILFAKKKENGKLRAVSLVFLSMTLLSPIARSHQFIAWLSPLALALWTEAKASREVLFFASIIAAFVFYLAQALPYGKAAGMGTWANLSLWAGVAYSLLKLNPEKGYRDFK